MIQVCVHKPRAVGNSSDLAVRFHRKLALLQNERFDVCLQLVAKLKAARGEHFNAVVLKGIVRRGDHNARVRVLAHR